jgi:predicted O-methyltransferase YrrM
VARDNTLLARIRQGRQRLAVDGPSHTRAELDFETVSLPSGDCDVLRDLLISEQAEVVVEIGLAYGSSALAIAEALVTVGRPNPRHLIVDAFQDRFGDAGWQAIVDAGLTDVCSLMRERSQLALPRLVAEELVAEELIADAAFVDGSHIFHNVFVDLAYLRELVRPGGLVVLDDCDWPSVATAVRYFERNTGWQPVRITKSTRLRAFRLPDPPVEPSYEHFQPFGG